MGSKAFNRRLVHSVMLASIMALRNSILFLKNYIASELKYIASLSIKFEFVCVTMCTLVMSVFSHDFRNLDIYNVLQHS